MAPTPVFAMPTGFAPLRTIWRESDLAGVDVSLAVTGSTRYLAYALPMQHELEAAAVAGAVMPGAGSAPGGRTTFVFEVPAAAWGGAAPESLTDDQLLDWSGLIPVLAPTAASTSTALDTAGLIVARAGTLGATQGVTAVWLPGLLAISGHEDTWWTFPPRVITRNGRSQVWQARLEQRPLGPADSPADDLAVRAIDASWTTADFADEAEPLTGDDAAKLVLFTGVFDPAGRGGDPVTTLAASGVEVSMLGGSVDVHADLTGPDVPTLGAVLAALPQLSLPGRPGNAPLESGLDSFRWVVDRGVDRTAAAEHTFRLKYWGHRVVVTSRYQRVVVDGVATWLLQDQQLHFVERTVTPARVDLAETLAFGPLFATVTVLDKDVPALSYDDRGNTWVLGGPEDKTIMLHLRFTDRAGNTATTTAPLYLDVPPPTGSAPSGLAAPPARQTLPWSQRRLCLLPDDPSVPGYDPDRATFETHTITVAALTAPPSGTDAPVPGFATVEVTAAVPVLRSLHAAHPSAVTLHPVGPGTTVSFAGDTVFAGLTVPDAGGQGVVWPAAAGRAGLSATNLAVDALSVQHGAIRAGLASPTKATDAAAAAAAVAPHDDTGDSIWTACSLLGFVPLAGLGISDPPVIGCTRDAGAQTTTLSYAHTWAPQESPVVDVPGGTVSFGALSVSITQVRPLTGGGPASTTTHESATDVTLTLAVPGPDDRDVTVHFDELTFVETDGQRPSLVPAGQSITFGGQLAFVADVLSFLPTDMFSNPPQFSVDGDHATLRSTVALPPFAVGVFSLSDVDLAAAVSVPLPQLSALGTAPQLSGAPGVRIDLASKDAPFTVSVGIVGGGGWFGLTVGSALTTIDAGLDFGGVFSFDIGIASGGVSLTGGVRLNYPAQDAVLAGGFVHLSGGVDVLDLASVSIDVMLELDYAPDEFSGTAEVSVRISLLLVHKTISWSMTQTFAGSADPAETAEVERFAEPRAVAPPPRPAGLHPLVPPLRPTAWSWPAYCAAFAAPARSAT